MVILYLINGYRELISGGIGASLGMLFMWLPLGLLFWTSRQAPVFSPRLFASIRELSYSR